MKNKTQTNRNDKGTNQLPQITFGLKDTGKKKKVTVLSNILLNSVCSYKRITLREPETHAILPPVREQQDPTTPCASIALLKTTLRQCKQVEI